MQRFSWCILNSQWTGPSLWDFYPSAEMLSVYYAFPADWASLICFQFIYCWRQTKDQHPVNEQIPWFLCSVFELLAKHTDFQFSLVVESWVSLFWFFYEYLTRGNNIKIWGYTWQFNLLLFQKLCCLLNGLFYIIIFPEHSSPQGFK